MCGQVLERNLVALTFYWESVEMLLVRLYCAHLRLRCTFRQNTQLKSPIVDRRMDLSTQEPRWLSQCHLTQDNLKKSGFVKVRVIGEMKKDLL